jgi:hypothetical protein
VRDEATLEEYFNHYIHQHRRRILDRTRPNQPITLTAPSRAASPGITPIGPKSLFKKAPRPISDISDSPTSQSGLAAGARKERTSSSDGSVPDGDVAERDRDIELVDMDEMETEVEEVILVRKLGSLISLRDRRLKVLRELEMVCSDSR